MAIDPTVQEAIQGAKENSDPSVRAECVAWLAQNVAELNEAEYEAAKGAIESALMDTDPSVLMQAMQAMPAFNRAAQAFGAENDEDDEAAPVAAMCAVCGKPEWAVDPDTCEEPNCPYR